VVDDARFPAGPRDPDHDAFLNSTILRRFRAMGETDDFTIWSGASEGGSTPAQVTLEDLAEYENVVWSGKLGGNIHTGLGADANEAALREYLYAGGRLFVIGECLAGMNRESVRYPFDPPIDEAGREKLYFKFLYMQDRVVSNHSLVDPELYEWTSGLLTARSKNPAYPDLVLDPGKWDPWEVQGREYRGGVAWEGVVAAPGQAPTRWEGLDTLYTVETWNRTMSRPGEVVPSPVDGAVIGARYESTRGDTLASRQHGRVVYFDFQPWLFQGDRLMDAGTAAVNWMVTGRDF
jgi:hypothetical protein